MVFTLWLKGLYSRTSTWRVGVLLARPIRIRPKARVEVAAVVEERARDADYAAADHVGWVVRIVVQPRRAYPAF